MRSGGRDWLACAVKTNQQIRVQARHDDDFMVLHEDASFQRLIDPPAVPSRQIRKVRPER